MELPQLLLLRRLRHYETAGVLRGEPAPSVRGILEAAGGAQTGAAPPLCTVMHCSAPMVINIPHISENGARLDGSTALG